MMSFRIGMRLKVGGIYRLHFFEEKLRFRRRIFSVFSRGIKKKLVILSSRWWWSQTQKTKKENFLCTFNDQFKQIFFVGGVIFTDKIKKNQYDSN